MTDRIDALCAVIEELYERETGDKLAITLPRDGSEAVLIITQGAAARDALVHLSRDRRVAVTLRN